MLSILGLGCLLAIVLLLLSGRVTPIIVLVLIPILSAILAGFSLIDIGLFFNEGVVKVLPVVVIFIFAIVYFGIMNDLGLFEPLIRTMIAFTRGNVINVAVVTVIIAAVAHLDGSGASTFLIAIPALLPLYKRLHMSPYLLLLLVGTSAAIINMVPWGGPVARAAAVLELDPADLWRPLIPLQGIALILLLAMAIILGMRETRRISKKGELQAQDPLDSTYMDPQPERRGKLWFNLTLTAAVIGLLVWGVVPAGLAFMIAISLSLIVNFPSAEDQVKIIKAHAPNALFMASVILSAGSFLGIMNGSGMLQSLASDFVAFVPNDVSRYLHLIVGLLGVPFELILNTDAFYFALVPVVNQVIAQYGIDTSQAVYVMIIGNIIGTFISPFSPALWLGLGLSGCEMGKHICYSFFWMWGFSLVLLLVALLMGLIVI